MLNFIFWFILISILLRIIGKFLLPFLLKHYMKKFQQKFYQQISHINHDRKKDDTNVEFTPDKKIKTKKVTEKIGEYIDYEEIETK